MPLLTPHVPSGLIELMKDLAKEVLRDKPENIYEFAVVHFEKLIQERDGSMDKGYEQFTSFENFFDGQQRFAVPSNYGYTCQRPVKIQPIPQPRKSKSEIMASFQAMESINEEDVLTPVPAESPYTDQKYQNAIYVIQRYFRRYVAKKKKLPSNTLSAFTAAIIIQRTMRRLFEKKIKLKKDTETTTTTGIKLVQDDMDNVSEAASYTSSSTIQMLADGQEGRENRLASASTVSGSEQRHRQKREEVSDGAADFSSMEFREPTQDEEEPQLTSVVMVTDDDEEHSHSVVAATEMDRKSIADENDQNQSTLEEEQPIQPSATTLSDDTSTAHIGILSTKIGSNSSNHQNSPNTNNIIEIDRNRSEQIHINTKQPKIIPAGLSGVSLNYPQSLGTTPDTLPATSPHLEETQETFAVQYLQGNGNGKNNEAASSFIQGDGRIRKLDADTGESLKIYHVFYHQDNMNDTEFSDSLNESTMEKDSLEPEELDVDSLESNENVVHHVSGIVKRDVRQDDGSLYEDDNDDDDDDGKEQENDEQEDAQKFIELERVPTYLYGIHPARTPIVERKNRIRNSEESRKVPEMKYLEATVGNEVENRTPEEKSEEESLESKGSTSEESSVTQIENHLEQTKKIAGMAKIGPDEDEKDLSKLNEKSENSVSESILISQTDIVPSTSKEDLKNEKGSKLSASEKVDSILNQSQRNSSNSNDVPESKENEELIELPSGRIISEQDSKCLEVESESEETDERSSEFFRSSNQIASSNLIDSERTFCSDKPILIIKASTEKKRSIENISSKREEGIPNKNPTSSKENVPAEEHFEQLNSKSNQFQDQIEKRTEESGDIMTENPKKDELGSTCDKDRIPTLHHQKRSLDEAKDLLKDEDSVSDKSKSEELRTYKDGGKRIESITDVDVHESQETNKLDRDFHGIAKTNEKILSKNSNASFDGVYSSSKGETAEENILDHDQQVESQLQELQNLNDLQSGSEIGNIAASSENIKNYKVQHDANNNVGVLSENAVLISSKNQDDQMELKDTSNNKDNFNEHLESSNTNALQRSLKVSDTGGLQKDDKSANISSISSKIEELSDKNPDEESAIDAEGIMSPSKTFLKHEYENTHGALGNVSFDKNVTESLNEILDNKNGNELENSSKESNIIVEEKVQKRLSTTDSLKEKELGSLIPENSLTPAVNILPNQAKENEKLLDEKIDDKTSDIEQTHTNKIETSLNKDCETLSKPETILIDNQLDTKSKSIESNENENSVRTKNDSIKEKKVEESSNNAINKVKEGSRTIDDKIIEDHQEQTMMFFNLDTTIKNQFLDKDVAEKMRNEEDSKTGIDNKDSNCLKGEDDSVEFVDSKNQGDSKSDDSSDQQGKALFEIEKDSGSNEEYLNNSQSSEINVGSDNSKSLNNKFISNFEELKTDNKKSADLKDSSVENKQPYTTENNEDNITLLNAEDYNQSSKSKTNHDNLSGASDHTQDITKRKNVKPSDHTESADNMNTEVKSDLKEQFLKSSKPNSTVESLEPNKVMIQAQDEMSSKEELNSEKFKEEEFIIQNAASQQNQREKIGNLDVVKEILKEENQVEQANGTVKSEAIPIQTNTIDERDSTAENTVSTNVEDFNASAETSADFSSIGKDLEFFEDTIKYLRKHLGEMDNMLFDDNQNSAEAPRNLDVLNDSALKIQSAFRRYKLRKDLRVSGLDNKSQKTNKILNNKRKLSAENEDTNLKIDNHKVHALIQIQSEAKDEKETKLESDLDKVQAAVRIQSAYRGHRVRKTLKRKPDQQMINNPKEKTNNLDEFKVKEEKEISSIEQHIPYIHSPTKETFGMNSDKSQIPVAVIHPTKYSSNPNKEITSAKKSIRSKSKTSPAKQPKSCPTSSGISALNSPTKNNTFSRSQRPHVSSLDKNSIDKNDKTLTRDSLNQTMVLGNKKLSTISSIGYGHKSKTIKTKTLSTADLLQHPLGSKNVRDQFERKGKSVSISGRSQKQESFDLEAIKKELLSERTKTPQESGRKKKTSAGKGSPKKHLNGTKIPQKFQNKTVSLNKEYDQRKGIEDAPRSDQCSNTSPSEEIALSKTYNVQQDHNKSLNVTELSDEVSKTTCPKNTLNKTFTIRSSLNEIGNLNLESETGISSIRPEFTKEDILGSLEKVNDNLNAENFEKSAVKIQKTFRGYRTRNELINRGLISKTSKVSKTQGVSKTKEIFEKDSQENMQGDKKEESIGAMEEENSKSIKNLDEATLDKAAVEIQKTYRGYIERKNFKANIANTKEDIGSPRSEVKNEFAKAPKLENVPRNDKNTDEKSSKESQNNDLENSATIIQKTFRGYQSRKHLNHNEYTNNKSQTLEIYNNNQQNLIENDSTLYSKTDPETSKLDEEQDEGTSGIFESLKQSFEDYKSSVLDKSATIIQKNFRGYKTRKDIKLKTVSKSVRSEIAKDTEEILEMQETTQNQQSIPKLEEEMKESKEVTQEDVAKSTNMSKKADNIQSPDFEKSATAIQKTFRGYNTRKNLKNHITCTEHQNFSDTAAKEANKSMNSNDNNIFEEDGKDLPHQTNGISDSFDVEQYQNAALENSAIAIQKTFRGYKTRKELFGSKDTSNTNQDNHRIGETKSHSDITAQGMVSNITRDKHLQTIKESSDDNNPTVSPDSNKHHMNSIIEQHVVEENFISDSEDHTSINSSKESLFFKNIVESEQEVPERPDNKYNAQKITSKASSAGAVLENAASTIQKAYREYYAKKNNISMNSPIKSYSHGTQRDTTPKEVMENSDESSTFIGPDTSFDLSDVDSVETKSEKTLNYDKISSSENQSPINNTEDGISSTLSIHVHSDYQVVDNECGNTPEKNRHKRSTLEPTAPPLEEILNADDEAVVSSPKLKWFVGDEPIIPSDSSSSNASPPSSSSSPLVNPLVPSSNSKFDELSSIDASREILNSSNQQLTPSIKSAVVSTSSLLLSNINDLRDKKTLNINSEIVSANEENLEKEKKNLEENNQSEEISDTLDNEDDEVTLKDSKSSLSNEIKAKEEEIESKGIKEEKIDDNTAAVLTDLCKNCAEGIHKGGICSKDLIENQDTNHDQIKQFVLMEEENQPLISTSQEVKTEQGDLSTKSSKVTVKVSDTYSLDSKKDVPTEELKPANNCPAISLIPPSSEDDTSESHEGVKSQQMCDNNSDEIEIQVNTDKNQKEHKSESEIAKKAKTEVETENEVTPKANFFADSIEDTKTFSLSNESGLRNEENVKNSTKTIEVLNKEVLDGRFEETGKLSFTEDGEKNSCNSKPLEDAFKTIPGEELAVKDLRFEDHFSDEENIEKALAENQISIEMKNKSTKEEKNQSINEEAKSVKKDETEEDKVLGQYLQGKILEANLEKDSKTEGDIFDKDLGKKEFSKESEQEDTTVEEGDTPLIKTNQSLTSMESNSIQNNSLNEKKLNQSSTSDTIRLSDDFGTPLSQKHFDETERNEKRNVTPSSDGQHVVLSDAEELKSKISKEDVQDTDENNIVDIKGKEEPNFSLQTEEVKSESHRLIKEGNGEKTTREDIEIATELIESNLSDSQTRTPVDQKTSGNTESNQNELSNEQHPSEYKDLQESQIQAKLEKLIEDNLKPVDNTGITVDPQDLPTENSSHEVVEEPCVKKVLPPTPYSASSDPDESELESTTTKAESTTTTHGYDDASETDAVDIPTSKPDMLDAMTEKLREPEAMVERMHQRRASEHKISVDSATDQPLAFEEPIRDPIKPMQKIQKSSSTELEDEYVLQKLQHGDTTRESSDQSDAIVFGDSTSQLTESEDTFNENMDLHSLHRMNTIAANRNKFKGPNTFMKSVTIDDTVKYIDPEKSTEESGGSFCMDDALSEDVRKKMMAYSVSEADSDYYDVGDQSSRLHDDFNISTALDNFPSTDTDTTIVSAATKIQAGARGFLTRRRIRRASMGTKASLTEERKMSFGNDAIGESLDQLAEEEVGRRQFNRQTGVNSLPSALEHSDETNHSSSTMEEDIHMKSTKHYSINIDREKPDVSTSSEYDVNEGLDKPEDDSSQALSSNLEATLARRLTLQRGDALRNDSTPDEENGNGKQVDFDKNNPSGMGKLLIHEKTMVESTTTTTTRTTRERRNYSDAAVSNKKEKIKWFAMRQNSMPVQIDSEVFRVLPKHMRKRIKSAEGEKPKRNRLPRD